MTRFPRRVRLVLHLLSAWLIALAVGISYAWRLHAHQDTDPHFAGLLMLLGGVGTLTVVAWGWWQSGRALRRSKE
ncbi:MAG: hypothetical protein AAF970_16180 [Bacteroidota bacterium]